MGAQQSQLEYLRDADATVDSVTFIVNGEEHTVKAKGCGPEIGPRYLLVDYLRDKLGLTGTKYMCRQGGCGACVVTVKSTHPISGRDTAEAANACLLPLFACDGLKITTVEGLGNRKDGYNIIQERLVRFGGTQDAYKCPLKLNEAKPLSENKFEIIQHPRNVYLQSDSGEQWFKVKTLKMLFELIQNFAFSQITFRLVAGNTGTGIYKNDGPYVGYVDINHIPELKHLSVDQTGIILGGNVTLTWAMDAFKLALLKDGFVYAQEFYNHFLRIAGYPVRNRATLAGNLMLKHMHKKFPSDIFLLFETIGATLKIGISPTSSQDYTLMEFLNLDMEGKVIISIHLPVFDKDRFRFKSFKIGKRHKNTPAIVNAAFLFETDAGSSKILSRPRICFGGINPDFASVDDFGKIQTLNSKIYCDAGYVANEPSVHYAMICSQSCYHGNGWNVTPGVALTNTASNTFCRAPGSSQGVAIIETIMEHIAHTVQKHALEVRQLNFIQKGDPLIGIPGEKLSLDNLLPGMISELKTNADLNSRMNYVKMFNKSARRACEQLLERLAPLRKSLKDATWEQLIEAAFGRQIMLTSHFQHKKGDLKSYDIWGLAATEVEIDVLTGDFKIVRVDIIEDAGESLSPLVDIGQIEGSFIMGLSWWLTEELVYDQTSGKLLTDSTLNYYPMLASDIPEDFRVTILRNAPNPFGVLSSKATGEPPLNLSCSVIFALRNAIDSARREAGNHSWYQMVQTDGCDPEIGPQYLLVDYLRDKIGLTGTKYMCREGGCGACMVTVRSTHPVSGQQNVRSANSCLLPLFACDGLEITTVEALGNRKDGYDPIQQRLVKFGGTQCGFCTPGFVMNMHSVVQSNPRFTTADVEYSFDGNICRCTGFRSIVEAFKSLSTNPSEELKLKCNDIEDAIVCPMKAASIGSKSGTKKDSMEILNVPRNLYLRGTSGEQWFKVTTLPALFEILERFTSSQMAYRLVAGNTGAGVYKNDGPYQGFIEINDVPELQFTALEQNSLVLGGTVTITNAITFFDRASQMEGFVYAKEFYDHMRRVASLSIRNRGTIAGNLMLKHQHREFKSDLFLLFESVKATLRIGSSSTYYKDYTLLEFLDVDITGKVILSVHFPTYKGSYFYKSFKVGKRYQNAEAYVNAAFLFNVDPKTFTVLERPSICYGGINPDFVHANATEEFLQGQPLNAATLKGAMLRLKHEAVPNLIAEDASPEYRSGLAQSYLYRMTPGVVAFITAKDIPGNNNHAVFLTQQEEIFVESRIRYAGQPVGLLVATDKYTAFGARSKVIVTYDNVEAPVLDMRDSIRDNAEVNAKGKEKTSLAFPCRGINAQTAKNMLMNVSSPQQLDDEVDDDLVTIKGEFYTPAQYHFHMETQVCNKMSFRGEINPSVPPVLSN
ncbi:Indole-3-acetaldehyde oxidase [Orchesella cincta]|uniref:Indole-3-acetaldehyde oxidase n=1 Tax=Orchesella cincta TaxID=48709 RepID=A0A1D2NIB3_ORCCI|nr:Indole-3-acetaldehyde oxidase [Orchesella cincta]